MSRGLTYLPGVTRSKWPRPTREAIAAAEGKRIADVLAPGLHVVFVGINPGLYSGATGHHFARPGNRFWPALHNSGWTDRALSPFEDGDLPRYGVGVTNFVRRATAAADELEDGEIRDGGRRLAERVEEYGPRCVAVLGVMAYRTAFGLREAAVGPQPREIAGAEVWVLPNPSGLNAHHTPADFARMFRELREALRVPDARKGPDRRAARP